MSGGMANGCDNRKGPQTGPHNGKGAHDAPLSPILSGDARKARIQALNDRLRQHFVGGQIVITSCIGHLDDDDRLALFEAVRNFDDFTEDNDP